jgi:PrtD family type I secretion system ABC transporter
LLNGLAAGRRPDELKRLMGSCRGYFAAAAAFSLAINLLYLAGPLYMLQVYDRVVSSGSELTLVMLTLALLLAYLALVGLDIVRARILTRANVRLDHRVAPRILTVLIESGGADGTRTQALRDFDSLRGFLTGSGIHAMFDMPWAPIYIAVIFMLHPWLGAFALGCAVILVALASVSEWLVKPPLSEANAASQRNYAFSEMSLRNTEVIRAMAMTEGLRRLWRRDREQVLSRGKVASDRAATIQGTIRFLRLSMQSLILGLGAWLVIEHATTAGSMFAANILLGRALQPVEQVVGSWRNLVSVRAAYQRLKDLFAAMPPADRTLKLARPKGRLSVEGVTYVVPGTSRYLLRGVSFALEPGEVLGVIGPSGAGKSTLARHLVGVLSPTSGAVRLDGADIDQWVRNGLGYHMGYLPQDIELFSDTVANNISRFQPDMDEEVTRAATAAGVHDLVLRLPEGYNTPVGEGGAVLSGGYRQRLGLARAVFGDPQLVLLDEPSSNLDQDGDIALKNCITQLKARGVTVVLVSHRPSTIDVCDKILVLREGKVDLFGSRLDVLGQLTDRARGQRPAALTAGKPRSVTAPGRA